MTGTGPPTVGVDLGGTNVRAAVVDRDGQVEAEARAPTPDDWPALRATITQLVGHAAMPTGVGPVGVGAAGMVDREGTVHDALNIPKLIRGRPAPSRSSTLATPVVVDNDANVVAWVNCATARPVGCRTGW